MQIPYRHGLLSSDIDYEKLIKMQAEEVNREKDKKNNETKGKQVVKSRAYQTKMMHRGGKR